MVENSLGVVIATCSTDPPAGVSGRSPTGAQEGQTEDNRKPLVFLDGHRSVPSARTPGVHILTARCHQIPKLDQQNLALI